MAKGKYAKYRDQLPAKRKTFSEEPTYLEKVEKEKAAMMGLDLMDVARKLRSLEVEKDAFEASAKALNPEIDACSQILCDLMRERGMETVELEGGEKCRIADDPYCSIEDRDKLFAWLRRKKMQAIFTVNWQTMNSFVKNLLTEGRPQPPGVKLYIKTYAQVRGGNSNLGDE